MLFLTQITKMNFSLILITELISRLVLDFGKTLKKTSPWSFLKSQRGAPLLICNQFVYRCERKIMSKTYWLCIRYKGHHCNARVILRGNEIVKKTAHNHVADQRSTIGEIEIKDLEDDDVNQWLKGPKSKIEGIK